MPKIYIFCDDPTNFGGIQEFTRKLMKSLPEGSASVLGYYADPAGKKVYDGPLLNMNDRTRKTGLFRWIGSRPGAYLSDSPFRRIPALFRDLPFIRKQTDNLLKEGGNTLVFNAFSQAHLFCTREVLKNNRIVCVLHSHPDVMRRRRYDFGGFLQCAKLRLFRNYVDDVVFIAPGMEPYFSQYLNFAGKRLHTVRHGILPPEKTGENTDGGVSFVGRLVPLKHAERMLEIAKLLPEIKFHIFGDGPMRESLVRTAAALPNVILHGYVADREKIFAETSLLLIVSDYEGYPLCGVEALAYGKPILALNSFPAAKDLVLDGVNGILLDRYTPETFARAVKTIFSDYQKFHRGALESAKRYAPEQIGAQWREILLPDSARKEDGKR